MAVDSVLKQSIPSLELLVIDDGSSQVYEDVIRRTCTKDDRIIYVRNEINQGVSHARNIGVKRANGAYISFLDDDDTLHHSFLETALKTFDSQPGCDIAISFSTVHPDSNKRLFHYHVVKETLKRQPIRRIYGRPQAALLLKYPPQINSMVFDRHVFDDNVFDESLHFGEDIYLWHRFLDSNFHFGKKPDTEAKVFVRIHGDRHLSQATHDDVVTFLKRIRSDFIYFGKPFRVTVNFKLFMRFLLMKDARNATGYLLSGLRSPLQFCHILLSQLRLKINVLTSYLLYRFFRIDL